MKVYWAPNTISVAVAIALEEAKLPYDPIRVDFANAEQTKPAYLSLNPKGRVPALVLEDGDILTETGAVLDYIAAVVPQAKLAPEDPKAAAHMRAVMYYLASTMHVAHAHKMRGARWADKPESLDDMTAKVPQTMAACATYVEAHCLLGDYVIGNMISIADPYLYTVCAWLEGDDVSLTPFPKIAAYLKRMDARASVQAVRARGLI
ncbi:MAG: glutathione S-transferase family protein [Pseudomonadota bacterium]